MSSTHASNINRKNPAWLVIGTGTDVGKTVVTAGLLRAAHACGLSAQAVKPVQTGCPRGPDGKYRAPDLAVYREACPDAHTSALFCFADPCSPHLAASAEGAVLDVGTILQAIEARRDAADYMIVEGAGGLLVPLNESESFVDLAQALDCRAVLVAANRLGAINHVQLTLDALRLRGLPVAAVVMTEVDAGDGTELESRIRRDNIRVVRRAVGGGAPVVGLPFYSNLADGGWQALAERLKPVIAHLCPLQPDSGESIEEALGFDKRHLWHPYAPTHPPPPVWLAEKTSGTKIRLADGRELVDGMSSWWAAVHGYNHPGLVDELQKQAALMPHVMFGGLTHAPAISLAKKLTAMAPEGLDRVFFADSGSVAVEVALKMAVQYQHAMGRPGKCRIASALGGYHGDTIGAMSVCDPENGMHGLFKGILPKQLFVPRPESRFDGEFDSNEMLPVEQLFADYSGEIAAFIIEPVVQGAGGMWFYHPEYLRRLRTLCDRHDILLILDEIATGFGRTGKFFACEWAGVGPDILCLGKALTGGCLTLSAVVARDEIAAVISREGVFMHGPTFMANPLACAVAAKSLQILENSPWREQVRAIEAGLRSGLSPCKEMPGVRDVRVLGAIGVVEMREPVNAARLQRFFVDEAGVWIRPFAKLIYVMPPFIASAYDVRQLTGAVRTAVEREEWK
jgi:dethiobiotin synthase/adenosylmethionine-8-amino-7-oxononanoate transaminase